MTSHTLAARIGTLTSIIDSLEVLHSSSPVTNAAAESRRNVLDTEIALLHSLLDALNLDYEEARARELDVAFENAGR